MKLDLNPNCFFFDDKTKNFFDSDVDPIVVEKDEATARLIANFLWHNILPSFTKQIREGLFAPKDPESMIILMHKMGINVRYLGRLVVLAKLEEDEDAFLLSNGRQKVHLMPKYWIELLIVEMLARSFKVLLNELYTSHHGVYNSPASTIAALLNIVFNKICKANDSVVVVEENDEKKKISETVKD